MLKWAFVDFENVGSLKALNLSDYARIFVFCGPKDVKINLTTIPSDAFCRLELIRVTTMGTNNLDFHLAFYLGQFHNIAERDIAFHVVSNDNDFNGLINHIKKLGRSCKKVITKKAKPKQKSRGSLSEPASQVVGRLKPLADKKRPGNKDKLISWTKSQCQGLLNGVSPEDIFKELVNARLIVETDTGIDFKLEG